MRVTDTWKRWRSFAGLPEGISLSLDFAGRDAQTTLTFLALLPLHLGFFWKGQLKRVVTLPLCFLYSTNMDKTTRHFCHAVSDCWG